MRIGILTYHRAENYGALLQAYALRTYLKHQGYDAEFVDYWPEYHVEHYRVFSKKQFGKRNIKGKIMYLLLFMQWGVWRYVRKHRLNKFVHDYLHVPKRIKYQKDNDVCKEFDIVIYGSDQIWRKQNLPGYSSFNYWYFGSDNIKVTKKVSYAASMGRIEVSDNDLKTIIPYLKKFDKITVRENNLNRLLCNNDIKSDLVLDPVFLLNKNEWSKLANKSVGKKKYLLFYNLLNTAESLAFAEQLSKDMQLPIIEINMIINSDHLGSRYIHSASIQKFLSLILNAECVVSNSFHGVAFSLIFEKQFYALGIGDNSERVRSLLSQIGIPERYVDNMKPEQEIDYTEVRKNLNELIANSKKILNSMISL